MYIQNEITGELLDISDGIHLFQPKACDIAALPICDLVLKDADAVKTLRAGGSATVTSADGRQFFVSRAVLNEYRLRSSGATSNPSLDYVLKMGFLEEKRDPATDTMVHQYAQMTPKQQKEVLTLTREFRFPMCATVAYICAGRNLQRARVMATAMLSD
jgi:hypothetical protein